MADNKVSADCADKIIYDDKEYEVKATIGAKMAYCRKSSELTLEEMSEYFDIDKNLLYEYEKDITEPSLEFLFLFSKTFDIPMEKFVDETIDFYDFACDYDIFHFFKFRGIYNIVYKNFKKQS